MKKAALPRGAKYSKTPTVLPKMVLFDYGNNLIHESPFDCIAGDELIMSHVTANPNGVTREQMRARYDEMYAYLDKNIHCRNVELHQLIFQRTLFETLGLEFDLPQNELEWLYWEAAAPGTAAPGITRVLDKLHALGIRTGVVSNISFSGETLTRRINARIPDNHFEFIMASSECGFRKPSPFIFDLAVAKSGLSAGDIWFCGDNPIADIGGSSAVGMFPVWYRSPEVYSNTKKDRIKGLDYLYISEWAQFEALLDRLSDKENGGMSANS